MNIFGLNRISRNINRSNRMLNNNAPDSEGDPRNDSFWKFSRDFCCPSFSFLSATFIISLADLIIYILTLIIGGIKQTPFELLAPNPVTLEAFGMKVNLHNPRCLLKSSKVKSGVLLHLAFCMQTLYML
jgi:hypothetical protein